MSYNALVLVLAAGESSRIKHLLEEDEPVKAMIKLNGNGDRLIDRTLKSLELVDADAAVLTYPSEKYRELDQKAEKKGFRVLKQKAGHIKLPYLLELPYLLFRQYHRSEDSNYLQSFDSILTLPSDIVLENGASYIDDLLEFHEDNLQHFDEQQVTIMSKRGRTRNGKAELFKMDGDRIVHRRSFRGQEIDGYDISTQSGIYAFSRGALKYPFRTLASLFWENFRGNIEHVRLLRYTIEGSWTDYGNPETLQKFREAKTPSSL